MDASGSSWLDSLKFLGQAGEVFPDALVVSDRQGRIRLVNSRTEELFGYQRKELLGQTVEILLPESLRKIHRRHRQDYYAKPRTRLMGQAPSLYGRAKDGREFPVDIALRPVKVEDESLVVSAIRDISERKQIERELRVAGEIVRRAGAIIIVGGRDGQVTYVSPSVKRILGYEPADLLGDGWWEASRQDPDERRREKDLVKRMARGELCVPGTPYEQMMRHRNGEPRWILWQDARGPEETLIGVGQDITERKQAEQALRRSEEANRAFVDAIPDLIFRLTKDAVYLDFKPGRGIHPHVPPGEFLGRNTAEILPPDVARLISRTIQQALETGETQSLEYDLLEEDGRHTYEGRVAPSGKEEVLAIVRDITERKQLEQALRISEERYRRLAEASRDYIFVVNREDVVEYVNTFAARQLGHEPAQVIGRRRTDFFPADVAARQKRNLDQVFRTTMPHYAEEKLPFLGGEAWLGTWLIPLPNEAAEVAAVMGVSRDLTDRKRAEEELQRSLERFRQLVESLPVATRVIQNGVMVFSNSADASLFGFDRPQEIIGTDAFAYVAEEDMHRLREYMEERAAGRDVPTRYECRAQKRDGSVFPAEVAVAGISYGGRPASLLVVQDLTERKRLKLFEALLPVCCVCGKVRDDTGTRPGRGHWRSLDDYVRKHSNADFSHTFCQECYRRYRREQGLPLEEPPA